MALDPTEAPPFPKPHPQISGSFQTQSWQAIIYGAPGLSLQCLFSSTDKLFSYVRMTSNENVRDLNWQMSVPEMILVGDLGVKGTPTWQDHLWFCFQCCGGGGGVSGTGHGCVENVPRWYPCEQSRSMQGIRGQRNAERTAQINPTAFQGSCLEAGITVWSLTLSPHPSPVGTAGSSPATGESCPAPAIVVLQTFTYLCIIGSD